MSRSGWDLVSGSDFIWILLGGGPVKRINVSFFFELGEHIRCLQANRALPGQDTWIAMLLAKVRLDSLLNEDPVAITYCAPEARELRDFLQALTQEGKRELN